MSLHIIVMMQEDVCNSLCESVYGNYFIQTVYISGHIPLFVLQNF